MFSSSEALRRAERELQKAREELSSLAIMLTNLEDQIKDPLGLLQLRNAGLPAAASYKVWSEVILIIEMELDRAHSDEHILKVLTDTSLSNAAGLGRKDPLRRSTNPISNLCEDIERSIWTIVFSFLSTGR